MHYYHFLDVRYQRDGATVHSEGYQITYIYNFHDVEYYWTIYNKGVNLIFFEVWYEYVLEDEV